MIPDFGAAHGRRGRHPLTAKQSASAFLVADATIASIGDFAERTNDLSNGLIWPKDG